MRGTLKMFRSFITLSWTYRLHNFFSLFSPQKTMREAERRAKVSSSSIIIQVQFNCSTSSLTPKKRENRNDYPSIHFLPLLILHSELQASRTEKMMMYLNPPLEKLASDGENLLPVFEVTFEDASLCGAALIWTRMKWLMLPSFRTTQRCHNLKESTARRNKAWQNADDCQLKQLQCEKFHGYVKPLWRIRLEGTSWIQD